MELVAVVACGCSNGLHVLTADVPSDSEYSAMHSVTCCKVMLSSYRIAMGIIMSNDGGFSVHYLEINRLTAA